MKPAHATFVILTGLIVAGCAAIGPDKDSSRARGDAAAPTPVEGVALGALTDSALPKGACGMVLWTLDEERPIAVFRYIAGNAGELSIDGRTVSLKRSDTGGASAYGIFEEQGFVGDSGLKVGVAVRFSLGFDGGSYLERGIITVEGDDGWRTVVPAAGLAGCRSK